VLSVFWFVGFGWWLREADYDSARKVAGYEMCSTIYDMKRDAPGFSDHSEQVIREFHDCLKRAGAEFMRAASPWWAIMVADALSIGALWLLAWIVVAVGRWVAAGYRQQA
jgi:hypothetical protein